MNYRDRVVKATAQRFSEKWKGVITSVFVEHDSWCSIHAGGGCNCDPDITIEAADGSYSVDRQGNATAVKRGKC